EKPEQKPRLPVNMVLKEEYYQEDQSELQRYNEICSTYYKNRSKGSRDDTWTRQIANMVSVPARTHMKEFLNKRGFGIK
ncbi:MAG: hypothetical protein WBM99_01460, partial [Psychromonas sp.]